VGGTNVLGVVAVVTVMLRARWWAMLAGAPETSVRHERTEGTPRTILLVVEEVSN
jgi:hypothetical protein